MVAITAAAIFGFLLQGPVRFGFKTGIYPLVTLIAMGAVMKADVSADAMEVADATLKLFLYYALLMLVAFHAIASGRISSIRSSMHSSSELWSRP